MSASLAWAPGRPRRRARWRLLRWERPDWWLLAVAAVAWAVVVAAQLGGWGGGHAHHAGHGAGHAGGWPAALGWWLAMVAAMMLPLAARDARWLAHRSLARRRRRTVALHAAGFIAAWAAAGAVAVPLARLLGGGAAAAGAVLATAAAWHVAAPRRRVLRRCGAGRAPAARGRRADADCVAAGLRSAGRCLVTCGPAMLAMAAFHDLGVMAIIALVGASERRRAPNPERRAGRPAEALVLAGLAVCVAAVG